MAAKTRVSYAKEQREAAIRRKVPLVTIDIDSRHLSGADEVRVTLQGPLSKANRAEVRCTLAKLLGVRADKIEEFMRG